MKNFKNYAIVFYIYTVIICIINNRLLFVNSSSSSDDYFIFSSIDLGCLSYSVYPPSGTIIQNLKSFELQIQFNLKDIRISTLNNVYQINSLSDTDLLNYIKSNIKQKPVFSIWDKSTNLTYLPSLATSKKTDDTIWLTFLNLPVSNNLYFLNDIGIRSYIYQNLGPRSTTIFSTNGVSPPKIEINSFLNSCPTNSKQSSTDINSKWYFNNPSNPKLFSSTIKVELCSSSISVCSDSNQKYYYSIVVPVSVAKGSLKLIVNSIQYQNFQYKIQDFPITFEIKDDIAIVIPLKNNGYYNPPLEMMLTSPDFEDLPFFDLNAISDSVFESIYKNPNYNQVYISSVSFNDRSTIINIDINYSVQYFKDNYSSKMFIFTSKTSSVQRVIYIYVSKDVIFEYYNDIIECPPKSIRNSFTVNQGGSSTYHKIGFLYEFSSREFLLDQIKFNRDLNIKFGTNNGNINIQLSSSSSSTQVLFNQDNSISCQVDFGISTSQYQSLINSNYLSVPASSLHDSLVLPKSAFGTGMNQIGANITDWYKQVGFCNSVHGTGINNQIQHYKQNGGYSMDSIIPNWANIAGYSISENSLVKENRTTVTQDEIKMKLNSNQATFKFQIKSFEFLEPMIHQDDLTVIGIPWSTPGFECNGQFQVEILNFGKQDGLVHFDIDCIQDIYIEVLNYGQTIPTLQSRFFYVGIRIEKYYKGPLECQVSMSLDNQPLWSTLNKSFKKNVTIPIFSGCNIPDPCLNIIGEPIVSKELNSFGIQQSSWSFYENYLNSIEISTMINNIGNESGDFNSTLSCKVINPANTRANFFMINYKDYSIITYNLGPNKSSIIKFILYGESSPVENLQLNCSIITSLYNPNKLCWASSSNENVISTVILYPYDKCIQNSSNRLEPTIEYSKLDYSKGIANPYYISSYPWFPIDSTGMDPDYIPAYHPLLINSNDQLLQSSIRYNQVEIDKLYDSFVYAKVKNGGDADGKFTVSIVNCSKEVILLSSTSISLDLAPGVQFRNSNFRFLTRATNIIDYNIGCHLLVEIEMKECFSKVGKTFHQDYFPVYPPYRACAGNWLEPSLYKSLQYWESSSTVFKLPNVKSNWNYYGKFNDSNNQVKNLYYQDLTLLVENAEYGEGIVKSDLVCTSSLDSQLLVIKNEKTTQCTLNSKSSCFIKYKIISSPTLPSTLDSDLILCTQNIKIDSRVPELSSCWNMAGKSIQDSFNLTKLQDPCFKLNPNDNQDEVYITTFEKQSTEIKTSDWGLQDPENFYYNYNYYQNNQLTSSLIYYAIKTIVIENQGIGNGTIQVLATINNPNVFLISNSSTTICNIKSKSYCSFSLLFGYAPFKNHSDTDLNYLSKQLNIKLNFIVDSKICWSSINKTLELNINSTLPVLPCGLGSNELPSDELYNQVPQVSLIYPKEYTFGNFNYYKYESNPLNLVLSEWLQVDGNKNNNNNNITNDYYQIKLMGYIYNMGDSGGMVTFKVECSNQYKVSSVIIENKEIVTFIESGSYYNFKFLIHLKESSVNPSIIHFRSVITCSVSSIVNNEKCWNPYGKVVNQDIILPLEYFNNDNDKSNNELKLLMYTLIPVSVLVLIILIILIIKYHKFILHYFNKWRINRYQNKLLKPKTAELEFIKPIASLINQVIKVEESTPPTEMSTPSIVEVKDPCGCGKINPEYHCGKCRKSIQNYCDSTLCKNLIHSSTLENINHNHQGNQLIIYNDPRFVLNSHSYLKYNSNDNNIEDLILKKLNKF